MSVFTIVALTVGCLTLLYLAWVLGSYLIVPHPPRRPDPVFRNISSDPQVLASEPWIAVLGDSSLLETVESRDSPWPNLLEQALRASGMQIRVLNAGMTGSTSADHLAWLTETALPAKPIMILYYAGYNDHAIRQVRRYPGPSRWPDGIIHFLRHWVIYKRVQARWVGLRYIGVDSHACIGPPRWLRVYRANLAAMLKISRPTPFVMVSQLMAYSQDLLAPAVAGNHAGVSAGLSRSTPRWSALFRHVDVLQVQKQLAEQHPHARFWNLYGVLAEERSEPSRFFSDVVHLQAAGKTWLVKVLAERIRLMLQAGP